ncbi:uncharacterized protein LOC113320163 isoform X1 [Papaver somniferum]|uniref:uncharacterized protein LOC113320163 isoform X1 n=1 Tax=Papaver somniferum TaxID=3469 RepID=UPI000E704B91|nr:uncharacterized protein LOC113320163 isoform X1 [Papaver somniferum]
MDHCFHHCGALKSQRTVFFVSKEKISTPLFSLSFQLFQISMEKSDPLKSPESSGSVNSSIHYQTPPYYRSSSSSSSSPGIASLQRQKPRSLPPKSSIYNPVFLTPPPSSSSTVLTLEERVFYTNLLIEYTKLKNLYALCCTYAEMSSNDREVLEHENGTVRAITADLQNQLDLLEKSGRVTNESVGTNTVAPSSNNRLRVSSTPFVQGTELFIRAKMLELMIKRKGAHHSEIYPTKCRRRDDETRPAKRTSFRINDRDRKQYKDRRSTQMYEWG